MKTFCITLLLAFLQLNNAMYYDEHILNSLNFLNTRDDVKLKDVPYQLLVAKKTEYTSGAHCDATLISATQAITAAHCIEDETLPEDTQVFAGVTDKRKSIRGRQTAHVKKIVMHPKFKESFNDYDIAVLTFKTPFELNEIVQPIALNTDENATFAGENCFVSGWRKTIFGNNDDQRHLKKVSMNVLSNSECLKDTFEDDTIVIDSSKMCARPDRFDSCVGEGGSPLVCMHNGKHVLAGVTKEGYSNSLRFLCNKFARILYTRVSSVQDFIQENMDN